jgi:hypothetical protein
MVVRDRAASEARKVPLRPRQDSCERYFEVADEHQHPSLRTEADSIQ